MKPVLLHVAEVEPSPDTGMGRVAMHWIQALEARGFDVVHVGPAAAGPVGHPALFARAARAAARRRGVRPDVVLVHEPASGAFAGGRAPLVVFSHGLERRGWEIERSLAQRGLAPAASLRTRLLYPRWRIRPGERGLAAADGVLLINADDARFAAERYRLRAPFVFRNGVDQTEVAPAPIADVPTVLFLGSWLPRKGVAVLTAAARELARRGRPVRWVLAGTGLDAEAVLAMWPSELRDQTVVVPRFRPEQEASLLAGAHALVLPSFFEGQPLALLQAMAAGRACLTSDCCGQRDLVRSGENGLLHAPGDAGALVGHLEAVATDAGLRARLGAAARESVRGRDWPRVAAEVAGYVSRVFADRGASSPATA